MHVMMLIDLERTEKQEKKAVQSVIIDTLHTNVLDYMLHLEELLCQGNPGYEAPGTLLFMLMLMPTLELQLLSQQSIWDLKALCS